MKIDISTKSHPNMFAEIDDADARIVMKYRWKATRRRNQFYVRGHVNGKDTLLHRFILRPPSDLCVDHINGDPLDNRRDNLRMCTRGENNSFAYQAKLQANPKPPALPIIKKAKPAIRIHTVKRKLADGTIRIHRYNRDTKERLENESV